MSADLAGHRVAADPTTVRARGKDERRGRLIRAARDLIAENHGGNFSMQELAARAGLSLATPYNLLGSKLAILQEVFRAESEGFRKNSIKRHAGQPVESVMLTVEALVSVFVRNPNFYRGLARSLSTLSSDDFHEKLSPMSEAMFRPLVDGLFEEQAIHARISPALISAHLLRVFNSTFFLWATRDWDEPKFRHELKLGMAFCFLGLFHDTHREALLRILEAGS